MKQRFIRIHGRVVPVHYNRPNEHAANVIESGSKGVAAGGAVYGAIKGAQYAAFKRGERLGKIADFHVRWPNPTMNITQVKSGKGFKNLAPDMFQQAAFKKAQTVADKIRAKAPRWTSSAAQFKNVAAKLGKYALPAAAVVGAGIAIGAFVNRYRATHKK